MKKQLLIAAVAATMTSAAIADISITGNMKVNYTNTDTNGTVTNQVGHEANLALTGKTGNTTVHVEMALDDDNKDADEQGTVKLEDVHLTTTIGDVKLKTGTWNGSDTILDKDSDRTAGNYIVSTTMSGVAMSVEGDTEEASTSVKLAGSVSGVDLSYKAKATQDEVTLATTVAGVSIAYANIDADAADSDKSSLSLGYAVNGFDLSYVTADADASAVISGDSYFGNVATFKTPMAGGDDISGFGVKTSLAGNTVQLKSFTMEDASASADVDFIKVVATRALAGGTTLEVTYTDEDSTTAANDRETFDVELAVKF